MTVLAAIDSSAIAPAVLQRAVQQTGLAGGPLHVLHVFHPPTVIYSMAGAYVLEEETLAAAEAKNVWEMATPLLEETGTEWVREDRRGYPPTVIAEYADEIGADIIVIGTRGRGGLTSLVLGSTSHGVIHDAHCDVLVVKGDGKG